MRRLSLAMMAAILSIALYFTLFWGLDGLTMLRSATYGLDDPFRSEVIFALGGMFKLSPIGLIKLAAFLATVKLATAIVCALYILDRVVVAGRVGSELLEAALILIVAISIASVGPAVWQQNVDIAREYTLQLVLAGIAAALCLLERRNRRAPAPAPQAAPARPAPFSLWR